MIFLLFLLVCSTHNCGSDTFRLLVIHTANISNVKVQVQFNSISLEAQIAVLHCVSKSNACPNISTTPITAMGLQICQGHAYLHLQITANISTAKYTFSLHFCCSYYILPISRVVQRMYFLQQFHCTSNELLLHIFTVCTPIIQYILMSEDFLRTL